MRWMGVLLMALVACGDGGDSTPPPPTPEPVDAGMDAEPTPDPEPDPEPVPEPTPDASPDTDPNDFGPPPEPVREARPAAEGALSAGVGVDYVNGPVGVSMAGYGDRQSGARSPWSGILKASQGFYGFQTVKALVIEVDGERAALVKIPTMSGENSLTDGIVDKLMTRHGIDMKGRVLTGATHSHHTNARYWRVPDGFGIVGIDTLDEEVIDRLTTTFADAIKTAIDDLGPAEWAFGYEDDWDPEGHIYRDRRGENNPTYPKDPRLSLLAIQRPDGTPMAAIINFGMHGTVLEESNDLLTEDAPGGLEMKFEDHFFKTRGKPIVGMFVQSGGGDASPGGDHLRHPRPARVELIGEIAAPKIARLYDSLTFQSDATFAVRSQRIDLRYPWMGYGVDFPDLVNPDGEPYLWGGWQCRSDNPGMSEPWDPVRCVSVQFLAESFGAAVPHGEAHQTYLTTVRLGDMFMISLPGEPAYSVIKYLRDAVAERSTEDRPLDVMAWGYSQDHLLYLTHPDDWFAGGYESEQSLLGPLAGRYMVDRQMQVVDDMLGGFNGPVFHEESPALSPPIPFEPRAFEISVEPGVWRQTPEPQYQRTQTVRVRLTGGDPSLSTPRVTVQRRTEEDGFEDVPSDHGWPEAALDNTRYHMITTYQPDPPMGRQVLERRQHDWVVAWAIPHDFPAGTYRLIAKGQSWDGAAASPYSLQTEPFDIVQSEAAALTGIRAEGGQLHLSLTHPPVELVKEEGEDWPATGWRLFDGGVRADRPQRVAAPLRVAILLRNGVIAQGLDARFDAELGVHVVELGDIELPNDDDLRVRAHQTADRVPSFVEGPVTSP